MDEDGPTFRALVASLHDRYSYPFAGLLLLKALGAWVYARLMYPQVPLSVLVIYRDSGNDMTYLPIISGLGKAGLHEPFVREMAGRGIMQFPIFSALPLTLLLKFFGPAGFIVADVLFLFATFAALALLFRLLGVSSIVARCLSLMAVTNVFYLMGHIRFWLVSLVEPRLLHLPVPVHPGYFFQTPWLQNGIPLSCSVAMLVALAIFMKRGASQKRAAFRGALSIYLIALVLISTYFFTIWGWRLPRPLVTGVFFYTALASLVYLARFRGSRNLWPWILFGACWAVLAQAYIYDAFLLGITALGVLAYLVIGRSLPVYHLLRNLLVCIAVMAVMCIPIAYQQIAGWGRPDLFQRYGGFSMPRLSFPHFWPESPDLIEMGLSSILAYMVIYLSGSAANLRQRSGALMIWLIAASLMSLPISVFLLGRTIQVGHFLTEYYEALSLGMATLLAYGVDVWHDEPGGGLTYRRATSIIVAAALLLSSMAVVIESLRPSSITTAVRSDFHEYASEKNYRHDFDLLTRELSKPKYQGLVLASFDVQLQSWWTSFGHGDVWLPDVFTTTMTDNQIENRLIILCKVIGMDTNQFMTFINNPFAQVFFLSHAKYMGSPLHTFAPLSDYSASDQLEIRKNSIFSSFKLYIPLSERARLRRKFRNTPLNLGHRSLNLLVLSDGKAVKHFAPGPGYALVYRNPTFRMWLRVPAR